ncbi:MAG: amidohydrolase family protein [Planctomycetales bacterium]|nr:amidohydrolase family protein [Planctomycetales bacterium]
MNAFHQSTPTNDLCISNCQAVLPDRILANACIYIDRGQIVFVGGEPQARHAGNTLDAHGNFVVPGYIDLHVHGGAGHDFMDGTAEAVRGVLQAHASHGTTTIFPTTTTGSQTQILEMIAACQAVMGNEELLPKVAGVHLYGPYFAPDKVGCHSPAGCRPPSFDEYRQYFETGLVRIATCAAELDNCQDFYSMARQHRCLITCGHSNASYTEMKAAFEAGVRHVDHFWCAMSSVPSVRSRLGVPMQGSMAEFVLMERAMSTEVIADGYHLAPELLEFAFCMLGPERLCLVTDCNRALDMPPGNYRFGNDYDGSFFQSDGQVGWALAVEGQPASLASSVVGMDHMVRHMFHSTSASLPEVIRMATLTPAERTGIQHLTGSLEVGKQADLLILNQDLRVEKVYIAGKECAR